VWTARAFAAKELIVPAITSEVKEGLWSRTNAVFLGVPQAGEGRHPEGKMLCLDGRGRGLLATKEIQDAQEKRGNLFWPIQRSSEKSEANLFLDQVSWSVDFEMKLPGGKKRKAELSWPSDDIPRLPVLLNPVWSSGTSRPRKSFRRAPEPPRAPARGRPNEDLNGDPLFSHLRASDALRLRSCEEISRGKPMAPGGVVGTLRLFGLFWREGGSVGGFLSGETVSGVSKSTGGVYTALQGPLMDPHARMRHLARSS